MQQTANYQLNQWDGEDRIMRVDFNSDNAKIDAALEKNATALSQATSTLEAALETERQARASGDTAANQATASAREELLNAIASEQSARTSGDAAVLRRIAAADAPSEGFCRSRRSNIIRLSHRKASEHCDLAGSHTG